MLLNQSLQVIQKLDGILVMLAQLAQYGQISALELQMLMLEMRVHGVIRQFVFTP